MAFSRLIIIGSSTGGTRVVPRILSGLPALRAAVVVVQHMPEFITRSFANTLQQQCSMSVRVAQTDDVLTDGEILIAPGGWHCDFIRNSRVRIHDAPRVNFVRPSVDVTMLSLAAGAPLPRLVGVILTGMGHDGADGLVHMKQLGALTVAQDQESCAVFGMPKAAIATGCVDLVLDPDSIRQLLIQECA